MLLGQKIMVSAEQEPRMGVCAPNGVQGLHPWSEGLGALPLEADTILAITTPYFALKSVCIARKI